MLARKSAEAVGGPWTGEPHAIPVRGAGSAEASDDVAELDLAFAPSEHAESSDRCRRRIVDQGFAVHAFGDRSDGRPDLLSDSRVADPSLFADDLVAALAEEERATGRSRGYLRIQRADGNLPGRAVG